MYEPTLGRIVLGFFSAQQDNSERTVVYRNADGSYNLDGLGNVSSAALDLQKLYAPWKALILRGMWNSAGGIADSKIGPQFFP